MEDTNLVKFNINIQGENSAFFLKYTEIQVKQSKNHWRNFNGAIIMHPFTNEK